MASSITMQAHAKINLCLNVKGKRVDGYHELEMVMVPLKLHDDIKITIAKKDAYACDEEKLVLDASNTMVKAVQLMRETYHVKTCFSITLKKRIPMQAGLAGGSSDGAAIMKGINELLNLHIPLDELAMVSKQIGADVPFCVMNTCAVVKGIGEKITPFQMNCNFSILLIKPDKGVATSQAFQMLDFAKCDHPDCEAMKQACENNDFYGICQCLSNSLEYSAFQIVPEILEIKQTLEKDGFDGVLMSGSGSTVFALTQKEEVMNRFINEHQKKYSFMLPTAIYMEDRND